LCNKYRIQSGKNGTLFAYLNKEKNQITIELENTANPFDPELNSGLTMDLNKFIETFKKIANFEK
jgi:hypothetical protein